MRHSAGSPSVEQSPHANLSVSANVAGREGFSSAVSAPVDAEGPARGRLTWVPFALTVVQQATLGEALAQAARQFVGIDAFAGTERGRIPFRRLPVVERHEGRLPAHAQARAARLQPNLDDGARRQDILPLRLAVRFGDARRLAHALEAHADRKIDLRLAVRTYDGSGADRRRRRRQWNMPLAGEQARGGIEANPAGTRNEDFGPGMQVGEILRRARRSVDGSKVRPELDQIAGD